MQIQDPWRFARPELARHYLQLLRDAPRRPLAIFGPRQTGKTHLLTHDVSEAAEASGLYPLYVDLWTQSDPLGAINTALAQALRKLTQALGRTAVTGVGALGFNVALSAPTGLTAPTDASAWMSQQFAEIARLAPDRPVLLMLDEAQTLGKGLVGDAAMKAVRGLFNAQPGRILLLLTGSSKPQLLALVGDHSRTAFKLAAQMDFPTLGMAFIGFVAARYSAASGRPVALAELDGAFTRLHHRPGEMIDFVRNWVADWPQLALADALEAHLARTQPGQALALQFHQCTAIQQAGLRAIVRGERLFQQTTLQRLAAEAGLPGKLLPGTLSGALSALEARGVLVKQGRGAYRLADEQLQDWLLGQLNGKVEP